MFVPFFESHLAYLINEQWALTSIRLCNHLGGRLTVHGCIDAPYLPQFISSSQPMVDEPVQPMLLLLSWSVKVFRDISKHLTSYQVVFVMGRVLKFHPRKQTKSD